MGDGCFSASGVWAPAVTALRDDLSIDHQRSVTHIRRLLDGGCHGVLVFGTTGEATSFAVAERQALLDEVLAAGVDPARLMIGTGCCALTDTVTLTRHAIAAGCRRILVVPPFYYKNPGEDGLFRGYAELIERVGAADLGLFFYHFPRLSTVPIAHPLIQRVRAAYPGVVAGLKDSSGDWQSTASFIEAFPDLAILAGTEKLLSRVLAAGGAGTISASANIGAAGIRRVYDLSMQRNPAAATAQRAIDAVRDALERWPMIAALKQYLAERDAAPGWCRLRPPLCTLDGNAAEALRVALRDAGL